MTGGYDKSSREWTRQPSLVFTTRDLSRSRQMGPFHIISSKIAQDQRSTNGRTRRASLLAGAVRGKTALSKLKIFFEIVEAEVTRDENVKSKSDIWCPSRRKNQFRGRFVLGWVERDSSDQRWKIVPGQACSHMRWTARGGTEIDGLYCVCQFDGDAHDNMVVAARVEMISAPFPQAHAAFEAEFSNECGMARHAIFEHPEMIRVEINAAWGRDEAASLGPTRAKNANETERHANVPENALPGHRAAREECGSSPGDEGSFVHGYAYYILVSDAEASSTVRSGGLRYWKVIQTAAVGTDGTVIAAMRWMWASGVEEYGVAMTSTHQFADKVAYSVCFKTVAVRIVSEAVVDEASGRGRPRREMEAESRQEVTRALSTRDVVKQVVGFDERTGENGSVLASINERKPGGGGAREFGAKRRTTERRRRPQREVLESITGRRGPTTLGRGVSSYFAVSNHRGIQGSVTPQLRGVNHSNPIKGAEFGTVTRCGCPGVRGVFTLHAGLRPSD
ncbi:hypothetical protein C8R43DRAFT_948520 [Mycena crocata]|nr:hypothetical protein C8R43DRAFT_948520 [Mycena crocata]